MTAQYHSKVCAIAHNAMEQLFMAGLIEAERMFEFDVLCRADVGRKEAVLSNALVSPPKPSAEASKPAPSPKPPCTPARR